MIENYICVILGMFLAYVIFFIFFLNGKFEIDTNNADKDIYRINLDDFDKLRRRRFLLLKIDKKANLTQK